MQFQGFEEKPFMRRYTKEEVLNILYTNLPTVGEYLGKYKLITNKYTDIALKYNYKNYRIGNVADLNSLNVWRSFTDNQKEFFNSNGEFLVIFNEIAGKPVSIVFRSLKEKQFVDYSMFYTVYGLDMIDSEFKYGDWLLLTEGVFDADSFRFIYNNILAMLTSNITLMQAEVLSTLTNKFVLGFDNDDAGKLGINIAKKRLISLNPRCQVRVLDLFGKDKDLGVVEEMIKLPGEFESRKDYYTSVINSIVGRN
jgi:hypothetical protein